MEALLKTRQRDSSGTPGLPPAPAPPSRDANPWPMSAQHDDARTIHPRARSAERKRDEPRPPQPKSAGTRGLAWLPSLMLVFVVATALRIAIESFESGDVEAAIGPLLAVAFAAFVIWRRLRRKRSPPSAK